MKSVWSTVIFILMSIKSVGLCPLLVVHNVIKEL